MSKFTAEQLEEAMLASSTDSWYEIENMTVSDTFTAYINGYLVDVELIAKKNTYDTPDSYGETSGFDKSLVFKADGCYFLKSGRYDSYVGTSWGEFREVKPVKTVSITYE